MTNKTNTASDSIATLTEHQLWQRFVAMRITSRFKGVYIPEPDHGYEPDQLLRDCGEHGWLVDVSVHIADDLETNNELPSDNLTRWIHDLEGYVQGLRRVREDFGILRDAAIILPEPPEDDDPENHAAWERANCEAEDNPRYRLSETAAQ